MSIVSFALAVVFIIRLFSTSAVRWRGVVGWERRSHTFLHLITLKHGCDLTDVLATCRFALLVKVYSETGRSSVKKLAGDTLFELFGAVFLFIWCGNGVPTPLFLALHSWSGVNISHSTVSRRLNLRFGLKSCKLVQKPALNP